MAGPGVETADIEALQRRALALQSVAEAATRRYERTTWITYVIYFLPVPLFVVIFRLHMDAWHYVLAGVAFVVVAVAMTLLDGAAVAKRDAAIEAANRAREALEQARTRAGAGPGRT